MSGKTSQSAAVHRCAVASCRKLIPFAVLMCPAHWRMVPAAMQRAINEAAATGDRAARGAAAARALEHIAGLAPAAAKEA